MAGRLGLGFCLLGFIVIAIAWNGAAGVDYTQGQVPYLISGGLGGLCLVVVGAALVVVAVYVGAIRPAKRATAADAVKS